MIKVQKNILNQTNGKKQVFQLAYSTAMLLFLSTLSASLLLTYRVCVTGSFYYLFLLWNLFLAWLPYLISTAFAELPFLHNRFKALLLFLCWLLFLPNSPYILTDLVHLTARQGIPIWFDALLIVMFAWTGLLLGLKSIAIVHAYLRSSFSLFISRSMLAFVILSCSFGIYVGRVLRWNSWDLIVQPVPLVKSILSQFRHPFHHQQTFGMTFAFSLFLSVSYYTLLVFSDSKIKRQEEQHLKGYSDEE
ncbi:MAG: DUF1361 domain-containing protein [Bacteroidia bacterium]